MSELHVWTDGCSWVIAESAEDAAALALDRHGERAEDYPDLAADFRALPDDMLIAVETDEVLTDVGGLARTCAAWATKGRGYLAGGEDHR